ncbi:hypothetical protein [Nocardia sp. GTS18]|uniref:hypothetical protein n=1 Tax=Nocardia sp. GTS18 TaxID=1778064 RepID=UPI0015EEDDFA|nr:hypothetical protein [Nocardia sp. GTS18]
MSTDNELDPSQVELGRFYPQALDQVWRTLTEPALIERWLMAGSACSGTISNEGGGRC